MTAEKVKILTSPKETLMLGIRHKTLLVAFGSAMLTAQVGLICWLGTSDYFRRQRYCTSIISVLVREGLETCGFYGNSRFS